MNTLFILSCPLGDCVITSCLLKDYKEQYPNETLYVLSNEHFMDLFKNNTYFNIYDKNLKYDKIYDYKLPVFDTSEHVVIKNHLLSIGEMTLQDIPYFYFKRIFNVSITHNTKIPCINLADEQKEKINSDKPICLINPIGTFFNFDCRYFGFRRMQQIVNDFKDKINFIAIGNCTYNQLLQPTKLQNLYMDLINKTTVSELLKYIYNADIIFTGESGIWHISNIQSDKPRHIIIPMGARYLERSNSYSTPNVVVHMLTNANTEYYQQHCLDKYEVNCLRYTLLSNINTLKLDDDNPCKRPVLLNGDLLSHCMANISIEQVENEFNSILTK